MQKLPRLQGGRSLRVLPRRRRGLRDGVRKLLHLHMDGRRLAAGLPVAVGVESPRKACERDTVIRKPSPDRIVTVPQKLPNAKSRETRAEGADVVRRSVVRSGAVVVDDLAEQRELLDGRQGREQVFPLNDVPQRCSVIE